MGLEIHDVAHSFGQRAALHGVSFTVELREVISGRTVDIDR